MSPTVPPGLGFAPSPEPPEAGAVLHGANGEIVGCDRRAADLLVATSEALIGQATLFPHLHVFDDAGCPVLPDTEPAWEVLRTREPVAARTVRYWRADGTPAWIEISGAPGSAEGPAGVVAAVSVIRDVTRLFAPAVGSPDSWGMEAIGRLASRVTHEFNNLLTVISGYNDLMLCDLAEGDPSRRQAIEVRQACDRGIRLTRKLLAISRGQLDPPALPEMSAMLEGLESPAHVPTLCTVLFAVSDLQVRELGRRILEAAGCTVFDARNGGEARAIAADSGVAIDVLVADLALATESGSELRRLISAERPTVQTLLLVARGASPRSPEAEPLPDTEFLVLPLQADELVAKVRALAPGSAATAQDSG